LVRRALRRLTAAQKLLCAVVILIAALVWWTAVTALLAYGKEIDYSGLQALGTRTVNLLQQYNPFFWWGLVALVTLLAIYLLYGFVAATQRNVRGKLVTSTTVQQLGTQLSPGGLQVFGWAWENRREPITVGVLQRTLAEMRGGRAARISLVRQHQAILDDVATMPA